MTFVIGWVICSQSLGKSALAARLTTVASSSIHVIIKVIFKGLKNFRLRMHEKRIVVMTNVALTTPLATAKTERLVTQIR